jgi:hypothetical protein
MILPPLVFPGSAINFRLGCTFFLSTNALAYGEAMGVSEK